MCRYFPKGCDINEVEYSTASGIRVCAAEMDGRHTLALVNCLSYDMTADLTLPYTFSDARVYIYEDIFYDIRCEHDARKYNREQALRVLLDVLGHEAECLPR